VQLVSQRPACDLAGPPPSSPSFKATCGGPGLPLLSRAPCHACCTPQCPVSRLLHTPVPRVTPVAHPPVPLPLQADLGYHQHKQKLGRGPGADKYYCGRVIGVELLPGSDGVCGPDNGPQCTHCANFQAKQRLVHRQKYESDP
jgi:hypothetical protein